MNPQLTTAIDTAAQHQIAAAPGMEVNGAAGGALIIGLILATVLITKWKTGKLSADEKKTALVAVVMTICLAGGSGIVGSISQSIKDTADQTGTTITQTSVGR